MNELLRVLLGWKKKASDISDALNTPEDIARGKRTYAAKVAAHAAVAKRNKERELLKKKKAEQLANPPKKAWYKKNIYDLFG